MTPPAEQPPSGLRPLRVAALIEGATLLVLVGIAVPLKYLAGYPVAVKVMGPIHGTAFLLYFWMVFNVVSGGHWRRREIARLVVSAFLPFGALLSVGLLRRKAVALAARTSTQPGVRRS